MTAALTGGSAAAPVREAWGWGGAGGRAVVAPLSRRGRARRGSRRVSRPWSGPRRTGVRLLENAQHVGRLLAVSRARAPADHDPLADIGAGQPDLQPVPHAGHLLAGQAARAAGQPAGRSST